ncbi:MAG: hypothetical protein CVU77_01435 [Elusimicrobia bacterium HGW-Elusimicrobia-1]|jgi:glycosidase|nr:MAG: hypothetical protein CVU77_01435 [Elusimicrobia bacterium HGW-Elusimicrobia-1]
MFSSKKCFFAAVFSVALLMTTALSAVIAPTQKISFLYEPRPGEAVNSVAVVGSFNQWNSSKDLMRRRPDGKFEAKLELKEGLHLYKLVVNGDRWMEDPKADAALKKEDGFGGFNSGIAVGETGTSYGAPILNNIAVAALRHDPRKIEYFNVITKGLAEIKLRALAGDVENAEVVSGGGKRFAMEKTKTYLGFDYWSAFAEIPRDAQNLKYSFALADGNTKIIYPSAGTVFTASTKIKFATPDWAKGAVWYQVMPERFRDGDPANNPDGSLPWTWDFSRKHPSEQGGFYDFVWGRRFGGDIQGLVEKLDYLKEMGVTALYLTPVFKAESHHKYNTSDYRHIDDNLGFKGDIAELRGETDDPATWKWTKTDMLFLDFLKKAKAMGFRVIIDGVFNHSGDNFWAFNDVKKKGRKSKYADWFSVTDWELFMREAHTGRGYEGWAGFGGLPEFREDENGLVAGPKKHIFDITRRWMDPNGDGDPSDGIDGWRLDVPENVKMPFWVEWSRLVKSINPDAYISGELWDESPEWLKPELFHAQMNYPFIKTTLNWLSNGWIKPSKFDSEIKRLLALYPYQVNFVQQNLFDSHDTDRAVSMLSNPGRHYDKGNRLNPSDTGDYNPSYKQGRPSKDVYEKLKKVTAVQFALPGAPMIWYGSEAGMWSSDDPFCREPMVWKDLAFDDKDKIFMRDIYEHYRKLSAIHNTREELHTGVYESVLADDENEIIVFARRRGADRIFVAVNNSAASRAVTFDAGAPDGTEYFDILGEKRYELFDAPGADGGRVVKKIRVAKPSRLMKVKKSKLSVDIPAGSAMILVAR